MLTPSSGSIWIATASDMALPLGAGRTALWGRNGAARQPARCLSPEPGGKGGGRPAGRLSHPRAGGKGRRLPEPLSYRLPPVTTSLADSSRALRIGAAMGAVEGAARRLATERGQGTVDAKRPALVGDARMS